MKRAWLDVSIPLRAGMLHWPGNPPFRIERIKELREGASSNVSVFTMGTHGGTHVDAPVHFIEGAKGVDAMPFEAVNGPARVVEIRQPDVIRPEALSGKEIRRGERVLFRTRNSSRRLAARAFSADFVHLTVESARWLAERRVRAVGVDYLSVGAYGGDGAQVHRALLAAGVWIIEGLDLSSAREGRYELACLPLRIAGGDGAPARALLRPS